MNVRRYFAPTAREALRALKDELGADAIVLSNRAMDGGVEILALPADGVDALNAPAPAARPQASAAPRKAAPAPRAAAPVEEDDPADDYSVQLFRQPRPAAAPAPARSESAAVRPTVAQGQSVQARIVRPFTPPAVAADDQVFSGSATPRRPAPAKKPAVPLLDLGEPAPRAPAPRRSEDDIRIQALQDANERLMAEMSGIRQLLERQLAGFAWGESSRSAPARTRTMSELLEAGFSASLARQLADLVGADATPDEAQSVVKNALNRGLRALANDDDIIDRGGVYALVGPTGVGKTTTTAKLAARYVVRHGAERLALITTDGYRIGAQEQLRIYGRILGVPVFSVRDTSELRQTLNELANKHMVLIDTVGMSQRDRMVAEQAAMLLGAGDVRRLLLLNATSRGDTLDDVVRAYNGPDLAGCIFSKVDEAASLAPVLDIAVRHQLDLFYVATGQRVPEDLHLPNRAYLMHRALKQLGEDSPYRLREEEAGLLMATVGIGA